jgi:hypothetical protein
MTSAQDSSVLFALDELREHERRRVADELEKSRQQAAVARRQAEVAAQRRTEAKKNAEDLVVLRTQLERTDADRAALERKLSELQSAARRPLPPSRPVVEVVTQSRSHHLVWTTALLVSCLGVFVATYSPSSSEPPVPAEPRMVAATECPEPVAVAAESPAPVKAPPETSEQSRERAPSNGKHTGRKKPRTTPRRPVPSTTPMVIDADCPLCGLPE